MRRFAPLFLLSAIAVSLGAGSARATPSPPAEGPASREPIVDVVKVDGVIDRSMRDYLFGTIDAADRDGATVVIQLDTPGALDVDALQVAGLIEQAPVPVIVWIGPSGARATGAGLLMAEAATLAVIAPGSGVGPLEPINLADTRRRLPLDRIRQDAIKVPSAAIGHVLTAQQALLDHAV